MESLNLILSFNKKNSMNNFFMMFFPQIKTSQFGKL